MLDVCENFATRYNICFSTDPIPSKSKSKCIYMVGNKKKLVKPLPLMLGGKELPWVETAAHLGHELHESGIMESRGQSLSTSLLRSEKLFSLLLQLRFSRHLKYTVPAFMYLCCGT